MPTSVLSAIKYYAKGGAILLHKLALVTTQDDRGLRNVWESATRCMGALGLGHRRFLYSYRSCTKDTQKLSVYLATYAAFIQSDSPGSR